MSDHECIPTHDVWHLRLAAHARESRDELCLPGVSECDDQSSLLIRRVSASLDDKLCFPCSSTSVNEVMDHNNSLILITTLRSEFIASAMYFGGLSFTGEVAILSAVAVLCVNIQSKRSTLLSNPRTVRIVSSLFAD